MSKMSLNRKIEKGILSPFPMKRDLTPQETLQLQEIVRIASAEKFKAENIKANTALIPDGQKLAEQTLVVAQLLEKVKNTYISTKLIECGYHVADKCYINLTTGEVQYQDVPRT